LKVKKKKKKARKESNEEEKLYERLVKMDNDFVSQDGNGGDDANEHTGNVSLSEDDDQYLERDLDPKQEMQVLLDYNVISKMLILFNGSAIINSSSENFLADLKKENNLIRIISKLFQRIITTLKGHWVFFQIDYLYIFHSLLNNTRFTNDASYSELKIIITDIVKNYFVTLQKNKLLNIESLFRFPSLLVKDSIMHNYDYVVLDDEENKEDNEYRPENKENDEEEETRFDLGDDKEYEYDGELELEKKQEPEKKKTKEKEIVKEKRKQVDDQPVKWSEEDDLLLIENYLEYQHDDSLYDILIKLFRDKDRHEIKHRVKTLKLKKGKKKALKVFKKLHKKQKRRADNEHMFNIIIELSDECKDNTNKTKIEKTITSIKSQLQSYQLRKGLIENSKEIDCILIPSSEEEISAMQNSKFQSFIKNLGFIPPEDQGDVDLDAIEDIDQLIYETKENKKSEYWKLNSKHNEDVEIMIEKLENFERVLADNIDVYDAEREEGRERAKKKDKKEKKEKKNKKEKKKKHKKEKEYNDDGDRRKDDRESDEDKYKDDDGGDVYEEEACYDNNIFTNQAKERMSVKSVAKSNNNIDIMSEVSIKETKKKRLRKGLKADDMDEFNFD
jgi:hypothetical protein